MQAAPQHNLPSRLWPCLSLMCSFCRHTRGHGGSPLMGSGRESTVVRLKMCQVEATFRKWCLGGSLAKRALMAAKTLYPTKPKQTPKRIVQLKGDIAAQAAPNSVQASERSKLDPIRRGAAKPRGVQRGSLPFVLLGSCGFASGHSPSRSKECAWGTQPPPCLPAARSAETRRSPDITLPSPRPSLEPSDQRGVMLHHSAAYQTTPPESCKIELLRARLDSLAFDGELLASIPGSQFPLMSFPSRPA